MLAFNVTALDRLAKALANGDDNIIERLVTNKLERLGKDVLMNFVPVEFGIAGRIAQAVETGGRSELDRIRSQWLNSLTPHARIPGQGVAERLQRAFQRNEHLMYRPSGKWWTWSRSRQEWLDQKYRHDWRTQPRDWHGRWTTGRLRHPYVSKGARRIRRARRKAARAAARGIISSWGR